MTRRISPETSDKTGLPRWFESNGKYYEIDSFTPDGKIRYKSLDSSFEIDPNKDFRDIIAEGIENGVFVGSGSSAENPNGTVLRAEAIFELCRSLGGDAPDIDPGVSQEIMEEVDQLAGAEAYYRPALSWFLSKNEYAFKGMYNYRDLEGPITWLELAYWLYIGFGKKNNVRWSTIKPDDINVSVVTHVKNGKKRVDERFASYKQSLWMKPYLNDIRKGKRYLPFPALCAFVNMKNDGVVPNTDFEAYVVNGKLMGDSLDIDLESNDWCLLEISRTDFERVLPELF